MEIWYGYVSNFRMASQFWILHKSCWWSFANVFISEIGVVDILQIAISARWFSVNNLAVTVFNQSYLYTYVKEVIQWQILFHFVLKVILAFQKKQFTYLFASLGYNFNKDCCCSYLQTILQLTACSTCSLYFVPCVFIRSLPFKPNLDVRYPCQQFREVKHC